MAEDLTGDGFEELGARPASPPIGDNRGPTLLTGDVLLADINERFAEVFKRADALIASEANAPRDQEGNLVVTDDTWEQKFTDMAKMCQAVEKLLDSHRSAEIQPYEINKNIIHGRFRALMDKLVDPRPRGANAYKHRLEAALTRYKAAKEEKARKAREEEARKQREAEEAAQREAAERERKAREAEREAAELEAAAARKRNAAAKEEADRLAAAARAKADENRKASEDAAKREQEASNSRAKAEKAADVSAADLTRTRGQASVSSLREFVDFRDILRDKIDLEALRSFLPDAAIEQAVRGFVKANNDTIKDELKNKRQMLRGVTFWMNQGTTVR